MIPYIWLPLFILAVGIAAAYAKQKQSSKKTFVSALFLMFVFTVMEWFPALRVNEEDWLYLMLLPLFWFIGVGMIFSVIAQMGFVIFLTIHRFALEIFRSHSLWNSIQLFLIIFVAFDLVYLRFLFFEKDGA
ncbi:hypothetical protein DT075_39505 [Bacillus licheniformis]|nr:hypothetical protein DT075_39505 [Bacillus licheniformis]